MTKTKEPRTTNYEGFRLHLIETEKYKTTTIAVNIKRKIEPENVTKRALLSQVLKSGTKSYPSSLHIHRFLEDMYGAGFSSSVVKKGTYQIISVRMDVSNERFLLEQTPLLDRALAFLAEVVQNPVTDGNQFDGKIVEKEKRVLKQRIQSIYDDKMRYANKRLIEEMFKDDVYAHHAFGKEEEVDSITSADLYSYYQNVLKNDEIDIYVIGDIEGTSVENSVQTNFQLSARENVVDPGTSRYERKQKENVIFDEQDVKQGKLHIGYRTSITFSDPKYYAMQVFNGIFGGFSHSKLFINVREKESLAYYAVSRMESHIGALFVMSGIEFQNYEKAVKIIREQMDHMKNGSITDAEFNQTKEMLRNQILESVDSPNGWIELLYHSQVSGVERTIDEWLEGISKVTLQKVVEAADTVTLDTIYFLKGEGQSNE
ncbi:EF-P 5-aminopentanol modification-associated protein YfmF [Alkalihalobacillus sp. AL-G]|uniref:EF-P 5-aminopentanol modification-associated protein YfmF n=1 Tax=Alkalihalobacillus sp. AL-G TaxID=2926399 RepID=UPI00272D26A5|nr:pitrilysin family protein [Alkalihalobacillus sp. AL-G]WLD95215.1 insulinase family protein [Alkalihalobacillus sp. AL-G]